MKQTDKILITGSSGFIGTHLMKALGDKGIPFDIKEDDSMDINNAAAVKSIIFSKRPKFIIHLAAISNRVDCNKDPELALKTNIVGTFNIMRIAYQYGIPVLLASSAATAQPELSLYGTSKDAMERLAKMFSNVIVARFYNVYGKGSQSVVNKFVKGISKGKLIEVYGNTVRDYIHVDDIVLAILRLVEAKKAPKLVEIGTCRSVSLNKLVSIIEHESGKKAVVNHKEGLREIKSSQCEDGSYGFYKITLEQGIRRLINE